MIQKLKNNKLYGWRTLSKKEYKYLLKHGKLPKKK